MLIWTAYQFGTGAIAAGSITAALIAANTITASQIASGTITATQIASATITGSLIAAGTITASNIASGTITASQIAAGTITGAQIAAGTITASLLAAGIVVAGIVDSTTITAATITGGTITGGTLTGTLIETSSTDPMVQINNSGNITWFDASGNIIRQILNGAKDLVYVSPYGAGNLALSISPVAGTDQFSDTFPAGVMAQLGSLRAVLSEGSATFSGTSGQGAAVWVLQDRQGLFGTYSGGLELTGSDGSTTLLSVLDLLGSDGTNNSIAYLYGQNPTAAGNSAADFLLTGTVKKVFPGNPPVVEVWHNLAIPSGWTDSSGNGTGFRYKLLPDGRVYLQVNMTGPATAPANGATIATLPTAYSPAQLAVLPLAFSVQPANGSTYLQILGNGQIQTQHFASSTHVLASGTIPLD